jgi:hypothetical protein
MKSFVNTQDAIAAVSTIHVTGVGVALDVITYVATLSKWFSN